MRRSQKFISSAAAAGRAATAALLLLSATARAQDSAAEMLPTGQRITPEAAAGAHFRNLNPGLPAYPDHLAGQAVTTLASHDGKTLLILTSGFNRMSTPEGKPDPRASSEYVFVFDISGAEPKQLQAVHVPDTDSGIVFAPDDQHFFVSGGVDDNVHVYVRSSEGWTEAGAPLALGHNRGLGIDVKPSAAGLDVSEDGKRLVVANRMNDSISVIDVAGATVKGELDLRPGKSDPAKTGVAGGEYPYWVQIKGNTAYVSCQRDREIDVVDLAALRVIARIKVAGTPNRMLLDHDRSLLYVAEDNSDRIEVIDTASNLLREAIDARAPAGTLADPRAFRGAAPNSLALSPDGGTLYATLGGSNAVAVVPLGDAPHGVAALIPTGWYPNSVSAAGNRLYVVNGRSNVGPNPLGCSHARLDKAETAQCHARNHYVLQLSKAGFLSLPVPPASDEARLTRSVAANNGFAAHESDADARVMAALRQRIKHVIYIVKENRTYDQVLGDLGKGNGDPSLTLFGRAITPNQHALATQFVDLDNFDDTGEVSGTGWPWSVAARETDIGVKDIPMQYAGRGQAYDVEGTNRNINVALPGLAQRRAANSATPGDADELPGTADIGAPDSYSGEQGRGHLWDAALRAHVSVRNYGFYIDPARYDEKSPSPIPVLRDPARSKTTVAYASDPGLLAITDPYFRSFDLKLPDFWREREWEREFAMAVAQGNMPALSFVRFMTDHTGDFAQAIDGVNTPEAQVADNDYAVGKLVERIARSPYRDSTLIFIIEDDAQDGPDHVDAHRSTAYIVGPYVKQGAVVSTRYSTVNILRTIEEVLGLEPLSMFDAYQRPMSDVFDLKQTSWNFHAAPSVALLHTALPIARKRTKHASLVPGFAFAHDANYWAQATRGYDWRGEDRIDAALYNRVLWHGLKSAHAYPSVR
ncbi:MAG TPA: bifunctional YncE family protein/alkaline phosphatase family protein [Rhizomicrobium sp.]|jgi:DNA-binding beta-propeller fold protein YncE|nr:bifunctional YncE family protein/alkaline phosphatase family protein [Rhizomicrobium sp.]